MLSDEVTSVFVFFFINVSTKMLHWVGSVFSSSVELNVLKVHYCVCAFLYVLVHVSDLTVAGAPLRCVSLPEE